MMPLIKLEWGNRKHIHMVKEYDMRMRGEIPCLLRASVDYCRVIISGDRFATHIYNRTGGIKTYHEHCVVSCPKCGSDEDLCFSLYLGYTKDYCNRCGTEYELRNSFHSDSLGDIKEVFVKQEE